MLCSRTNGVVIVMFERSEAQVIRLLDVSSANWPSEGPVAVRRMLPGLVEAKERTSGGATCRIALELTTTASSLLTTTWYCPDNDGVTLVNTRIEFVAPGSG